MKFRLSYLISTGIVAFWAVMMYTLVADRIIPLSNQESLIDVEVLRVQWMNIHQWMKIRRNGSEIGAMGLTIERNEPEMFPEGENSNFSLNQNLTIKQFGSKIRFNLTAHLSPVFNLESFAARGSGFGLEGEAQGFVEGGVIYFRIRYSSPGQPITEDSPWLYSWKDLGDGALSMQGAVESMMSRNSKLAVGETYSFESVNPLGGMQKQVAHVEVVEKTTITLSGEEKGAYRLETTMGSAGAGVSKRSSWVDRNGSMLRTELMMGYTAEQGNPSAIIQKYPWLGDNEVVPEFDREAFMLEAEESGAISTDSEALNGINFLQMLEPYSAGR
jgi:hypothetical protein